MVYRQTFLEAIFLITASILLGFSYTFVTKQGFFSEKKPTPSDTTSNLELIPLVKAQELFESKGALFIDARQEFDFATGHIHGAINITLKEFDIHRVRLKDTPKNTLLIIYCDGVECNSSIELAIKLMEVGFTNVKVFFGGWQEWSSAHLPVDK